MNTSSFTQSNRRRFFLRVALIGFALLLTLASSGCVSEEKYKTDVNAARQQGIEQGRVEGARAEREAAQTEIKKIMEASRVEAEKLRQKAEAERIESYLGGYDDAAKGLPLGIYKPLETPPGLVWILFYLCLGILMLAVVAASIYIIARAGGARDKLARILPLGFSFYIWYRLIRPPGEPHFLPNFRAALANSGTLELALITISFAACHGYMRLSKSSPRRLFVDALSVFVAGVIVLQLLEYGFNAEQLVQLGSPTFALRLALAPVIGGTAYALLYVGKVIVQKAEPEVENVDPAGSKPPGGRLFQDS